MTPLGELHAWLRKREPQMLRLLRRLVEIESPSHDKAAVDRCGALLGSEWRKRGGRTSLLRQTERGHHLRVALWLGRGRPRGQILILGHLDTVYPLGTLEEMPFRLSRGRAWGPGTFDMKGGLTIALAAVDALRARHFLPRKTIVCLWTSDEEIGSPTSRRAIESEARRSDAVLVLEPSLGAEGRLKTERKGVGEAEVVVTGRSAHAGIDPQRGVNAVHELALQIAHLLPLNDARRGITVQANVIEGGTASNVVPAHASAKVDLRVRHAADVGVLHRKLQALRPILPGARIEIRGGINRPPMERTAASRALFTLAGRLARQMGIALGQTSTGGGSDGNFTAALGIPTLDGLGAIGDGAHSPREHVVVRSLAERAALLAGLLAHL